jgi:hypothetical protein
MRHMQIMVRMGDAKYELLPVHVICGTKSTAMH